MTLLYGRSQYHEGASDVDDVRSTVTIVDGEDITPEAKSDPEFNHVDTDPDTEGGLTTRDVSDRVHASEPVALDVAGNATTDFSGPIDSQVSTSGTAAARESAGEWGRGTARYTDSIEPVIREGAEFNDVYFSAKRPTIQDGALDYMVASRQPDDGTAEANAASSAAAARKAAAAAMYQRFLDDRTN